MDSIPHKENEPKWIIYRGQLPVYLERGRLPSLPFEELDYATGSKDWVKVLNARQEDAIRIFNEAVNTGRGTYDGHYIQCRCKGQ